MAPKSQLSKLHKRIELVAGSFTLVALGILLIIVGELAVDLPAIVFLPSDSLIRVLEKTVLFTFGTFYCSSEISGNITFGITTFLFIVSFGSWAVALIHPSRLALVVSYASIMALFTNAIIQSLLVKIDLLQWCGF